MTENLTSNRTQMRNSQSSTYRFCGFSFDTPEGYAVNSVEVDRKTYIVRTNKEIFLRKACFKCKKLLPSDQFYQNKSPCKSCHMKLVKSWQAKNPEAVKRHKQKNNKTYRYNQKRKAAGFL